MSQSLAKKWLIAQIKPNSYDLAIRNVKRQGFEVFIPKMETTIKKENRFIYKNVFVFPGYMFIGFDRQNFTWTKINSTYGISKVLVFNKKPSEISYDLIVALKNRYGANIDPMPKESLQKGDTIKLNAGPFVDLIAKIENVDETNRIWLLLEAMGGYRRLRLQQLEKLKYNKV
jgi:transcriptional antiterminator RfaH